MGVAPPPDAGRWSSVPPWIHAGNIDNKEFVAGTTLYIPVWVEGALFEAGDGHAAQGDGDGIEPGPAYQLVSVACDLRITQLVDRKVGVHVMIPKSLFVGREWAP